MGEQHGISWRRNLYVLWVAEVLTILGFTMCYPFLPFYLATLGAESVRSQVLWAGAIWETCTRHLSPVDDAGGAAPVVFEEVALAGLAQRLMRGFLRAADGRERGDVGKDECNVFVSVSAIRPSQSGKTIADDLA